MSNSIHSVQTTINQDRTDQSVQPPKTPQQKTATEPLQDQVTLSDAAKQALANQS